MSNFQKVSPVKSKSTILVNLDNVLFVERAIIAKDYGREMTTITFIGGIELIVEDSVDKIEKWLIKN